MPSLRVVTALGLRARPPASHRVLASLPAAPHIHSSDPQAQSPGSSPSRYPGAHGTTCLCPERCLGTHRHPGGRAWSWPGWQRVRLPGHVESRSCAGSSSGRSSSLMSRSSDISGKPETEVVTAAVKNPGFQMHAQVCVCGGDAQRWRVGTTHTAPTSPLG